MKKIIVLLIAGSCAQAAVAGSVGGFGGGTEVTQILNNIQLVQQYEQQLVSFAKQGQQFAAQLQNLQKNPASIMNGDVLNLIQGIGRIMSAEQSMGGSLAQIDRKFAATFNSPTAASLATQYSGWTNTSKATLQGAMQAAGMHRDAYASNTDALRALYDESQASDGNLAAIQTLSKINAKQVESTMALGDLMATQNIASSTYMAEQTSRAQARSEANSQVMQFGKPELVNPANYKNKF